MCRSLPSTKVNANLQMFRRRLRGRGGCHQRVLIKWKNSVWKERISFDLFMGVSGSWMISPHKRAYINRFPPTPCLLPLLGNGCAGRGILMSHRLITLKLPSWSVSGSISAEFSLYAVCAGYNIHAFELLFIGRLFDRTGSTWANLNIDYSLKTTCLFDKIIVLTKHPNITSSFFNILCFTETHLTFSNLPLSFSLLLLLFFFLQRSHKEEKLILPWAGASCVR